MLPELLPLDALAVHALLHQGVAHGVDGVAAAAHVHHELVHAVDEAIDGGRRFTRLAAPAAGRLAHRRDIGEPWIAAGPPAELRGVSEPRRHSGPATSEAGGA